MIKNITIGVLLAALGYDAYVNLYNLQLNKKLRNRIARLKEENRSAWATADYYAKKLDEVGAPLTETDIKNVLYL